MNKYEDDARLTGLFPKSFITGVIKGHTDQVMDIAELNIPFSIASASLDKTIRIYSI